MKTSAFVLLATLPVFLCPLPSQAGFLELETKIAASDATPDDYFGVSVALSGEHLVVGADRKDGVFDRSGAAYVFDVATGDELHKLTPGDQRVAGQFGLSVATAQNLAVVGTSSAYNHAGISTGAAYLFDLNTGKEIFKLTASDGGPQDLFGYSVAIGNTAAVVGAWRDDDWGFESGSAYVFDIATGQEKFKLTASDAARGDLFGSSVAISGATAIIAASSNDDSGSRSGSVYLFDVTTGDELFKLTASDAEAGDFFGSPVAIHGNTAIIGAAGDDDGGSSAGAAYLFDVTTGEELFKLTASDAEMHDSFGSAVAIFGDHAIVGSFNDDETGSVYMFDVNTGKQLMKFAASDVTKHASFGSAVAIWQDVAVVGAYGDDEGGASSGAVYLFSIGEVPEPASSSLLAVLMGITTFCAGRRCTNSYVVDQLRPNVRTRSCETQSMTSTNDDN